MVPYIWFFLDVYLQRDTFKHTLAETAVTQQGVAVSQHKSYGVMYEAKAAYGNGCLTNKAMKL